MQGISFTQYMRPNGRQEQISIERDPEVEAKAKEIEERGYRFEAEVLMNGMVSFTVFSPVDDVDVASELVSNGPKVLDAVDRLVNGWHAQMIEDSLK